MTVSRRKTVCFVVSDFLDEGFEKALQSANCRHDVVAVLVSDPRERAVTPAGLVTLRDPESGRVALLDTSSRTLRRAFAARSAERIVNLKKRLEGLGIDFIHIDAAGSVVDPLVRFFRMRERRMRR